jgi:hypothetical protein
MDHIQLDIRVWPWSGYGTSTLKRLCSDWELVLGQPRVRGSTAVAALLLHFPLHGRHCHHLRAGVPVHIQ